MATPHNQGEKGQVARTVLMPGDPLRAQFIAKEYLTDAVCFNEVRNMFGYTGLYKGTRISVMGSGMGMPSMGIYSYELYHNYDVENIIRIGSAGALSDDIHVMDIVYGMGACTDSNYVSTYNLPGNYAPIADYRLLSTAVACAEKLQIQPHVGNILSSDIFYNDDNTVNDRWKKMNVLAVDMEAAALYMNAARAQKRALTMLTVSDHLYTGERLDAKKRQTGFSQMMEIALNTAVNMEPIELKQ